MTDGSKEQLVREAQRLIRQFGPTRFILGADCTLPTELPYERVRWLAEAARGIEL
jgi:uroporphyrinogen decarboxylase